MNICDFMKVYQVFHATDHSTKSAFEAMLDPTIPAERFATWIDGTVEDVRELTVRVMTAVDAMGGFFDNDKPPGAPELRESLVVVLAKIDEALKIKKQMKKKPKVKRKATGDPNQEAMFEKDEDDPSDLPGDPG